MRSTLESWLAKKSAGTAVVLIALLAASPSLSTGLAADDFFHKLILTGSDAIGGVPDNALDMFVWASGDRDVARAYMDVGMTGWWTDPDLVMAYFRPVTAFTHWLDYQLWPDSPWLMHAQSLLWFGLCLLLLRRAYGVMRGPSTAAWVATLGLALYALDDAHAMTIAWVANRNALVALAAALVVLLLHDHGSKHALGRWLAPPALLVALFAGEAALAITGYLFAYALFVDPRGRRTGLLRLIPHTLVVLGWAALYRGLGYGAHGSGLVVDPGAEPIRFVSAVLERLPILMTSQYAFPPTDLWEFYGLIRHWLPAAVMAWSVAVMVGLLLLLRPIFRQDPHARFWALGSLLACLPVCAQWPHDRLLMFVGIGAMPLIAALIARNPAQWATPARLAVAGLMFFHLIFGPLWFPVRTRGPLDVTRMLSVGDRSIDDSEAVRQQTIVLVNPPMDAFAGYLPPTRAAQGLPFPKHIRWLASGATPVEVTRLDDHTLRVTPEGGFLSRPSERMQRGAANPMAAGQVVRMEGMQVTVDRLTDDQRPAQATVHFELPLDDERLTFLHWTPEGFVPFALPTAGDSRTLPAIDFFRLLP